MAAKTLGKLIFGGSDRSRAAREAGAEQMNMEGGYFHGTASDIKEFSPIKRGESTAARSAQKAFWVSDDPVTAGGYAEHAATYAPVQKLLRDAEKAEKAGNFDLYEQKIIQAEDLDSAISRDNLAIGGQNIMPLRVNANLKTVDMKGKSFDDEGVSDAINMHLDSAKEGGFAGVKFLNLDDAAGLTNRPATHVAVFDPKDIRSEFAEFDPSKADSPNLLASAAPVGIAGLLGALGSSDQAEASSLQNFVPSSGMLRSAADEMRQQNTGDAQALALDTIMGFFAPTRLAGREAQMMPMSQQTRGR